MIYGLSSGRGGSYKNTVFAGGLLSTSCPHREECPEAYMVEGRMSQQRYLNLACLPIRRGMEGDKNHSIEWMHSKHCDPG